MSVDGGKVYYLHLGYYKNGNTDDYDDEFTINSVSYRTEVGKIHSKAGAVIKNNGTLDLRVVNLVKDSVNGYVVDNNAVLEINGAKISAETAKGVALIYNAENADLTINSGKIYGYAGSKTAILNDSVNDLYINGGYIRAGLINQNGGTVRAKNCCIRALYSYSDGSNITIENKKGNIVIESGFYSAPSSERRIIDSTTGNVTITGGLFKNSEYQVTINGEGELNISGGRFIGSDERIIFLYNSKSKGYLVKVFLLLFKTYE